MGALSFVNTIASQSGCRHLPYGPAIRGRCPANNEPTASASEQIQPRIERNFPFLDPLAEGNQHYRELSATSSTWAIPQFTRFRATSKKFGTLGISRCDPPIVISIGVAISMSIYKTSRPSGRFQT